MNFREIKAFIHRSRIADVVEALSKAGYEHLTVIDVQGMLKALDSKEQQYSIKLGQKVITEMKLEVVCADEQRTAEAVQLIKANAQTGQPDAGYIYISEVKARINIPD